MISYVGILNTGSGQKKIRIYLDLNDKEMYFTEAYIGDKKFEAKIEGDICTVYGKKICNNFCSPLNFICGYDDKIIFHLTFTKYNDETIVTGREDNIGWLCFPRITTPKFFVITDREEV